MESARVRCVEELASSRPDGLFRGVVGRVSESNLVVVEIDSGWDDKTVVRSRSPSEDGSDTAAVSSGVSSVEMKTRSGGTYNTYASVGFSTYG